MWVYLWTDDLILTYDFTQSNAGWDADWCSRDSRWFYSTNTWSDHWITSPSEVLSKTPKKITIVFNKVNQSSWTALGGKDMAQDRWYALPMDYNQQQRLVTRVNGSNTTYNLSWIPSWETTWEMNVDKSTIPRTVTHKITWLTDVTETSWVLDYIWGNGDGVTMRIVNRSDGTGSMCIQSVTFEY